MTPIVISGPVSRATDGRTLAPLDALKGLQGSLKFGGPVDLAALYLPTKIPCYMIGRMIDARLHEKAAWACIQLDGNNPLSRAILDYIDAGTHISLSVNISCSKVLCSGVVVSVHILGNGDKVMRGCPFSPTNAITGQVEKKEEINHVYRLDDEQAFANWLNKQLTEPNSKLSLQDLHELNFRLLSDRRRLELRKLYLADRESERQRALEYLKSGHR